MKNKGSKHLLTATLATLIALTTAAASVMTGCGDNSESVNATTNVVETSIVTEIIEYTQVVTDKENSADEKSENDENESSEKPENGNVNSNSSNSDNDSPQNNAGNGNIEKPESSANNSGNSSNQNNSSSSNNNQSSNNSSNNNNSSSNNSSSSKPNSTSKVLTVDGKKYNVGDTITCVYKVTAPENLENYEATITYDSDYVEATSAVLGDVARVGGLCNHRLTEEVRMNGVNISEGYNFKKGEDLITVTYLVKAGGKTSIDFNWRVATQFVTKGTGKAYVVDGKAVSGLKLEKIYS